MTIDAMIVNVALPSMQSDLGFSSQLSLQWVINAYVLPFGGVLLLGGRPGDLVGRQRLLVVGLILFTGASLASGLAQNPGVLIGGRVVQGLGAALVSPAVPAIIVSTFTEAAERTKALGIFSAVTAAASAAGIIVGGVLTQELSWRWIFLVNICLMVQRRRDLGADQRLRTRRRYRPYRRSDRERRVCHSADVAGSGSLTALGQLDHRLKGNRYGRAPCSGSVRWTPRD